MNLSRSRWSEFITGKLSSNRRTTEIREWGLDMPTTVILEEFDTSNASRISHKRCSEVGFRSRNGSPHHIRGQSEDPRSGFHCETGLLVSVLLSQSPRTQVLYRMHEIYDGTEIHLFCLKNQSYRRSHKARPFPAVWLSAESAAQTLSPTHACAHGRAVISSVMLDRATTKDLYQFGTAKTLDELHRQNKYTYVQPAKSDGGLEFHSYIRHPFPKMPAPIPGSAEWKKAEKRKNKNKKRNESKKKKRANGAKYPKVIQVRAGAGKASSAENATPISLAEWRLVMGQIATIVINMVKEAVKEGHNYADFVLQEHMFIDDGLKPR